MARKTKQQLEEEQMLYERGRQRVAEIKDFFGHFIAYVGVILVLLVINIVSSPGSWWFYWVALFWGIGIFWHAIATFGLAGLFDKSWEERKIQEYVEKNKTKTPEPKKKSTKTTKKRKPAKRKPRKK